MHPLLLVISVGLSNFDVSLLAAGQEFENAG